MATITTDEEAVLRSFVGQTVDIGILQDSYDRLDNFDKVVLEELNRQLSILVSDTSGVIVVDGLTVNKTENIRALRERIKEFKNGAGTGLEDTQTYGAQISAISRPDYR